MNTRVEKVMAREILDSRGNPTVEVDLAAGAHFWARAAVPSGASTGAHEAHELRDQDRKRYLGKGVTKAVRAVMHEIAPKIVNFPLGQQDRFDRMLIELDGTKNKSRLGANAILGVSLAYAKLSAQAEGLALHSWLSQGKSSELPVPLMNVINGGAHADNGLDVQEFMIVPLCGGRFSEALRAGVEVFHHLKATLHDKKLVTAVGDEGGFAPSLRSNREALDLLMMAIEKAGYRPGEDVRLALDVAATELFDDGTYHWEGRRISADELGEIYEEWSKNYPLMSVEDGFAEDDWQGWIDFTGRMGQKLQLVGDDLFVTNPERLQSGIDRHAANAILVKVNQIGTLSETIAAVRLAQKNNFRTVMSHRSGETEDAIISDLAVGLGSQQIKTGSLCRGERTAKYNQLLRIEEQLGSKATYWGDRLRTT